MAEVEKTFQENSKPLMECAECMTVSTADEFMKTIMIDDSTGQGIHEETKFICPDCGSENVVEYDSRVSN
jgi:predicted RNA-binding Zn-ribbon protein involved in translation (DUF1610 family)